MKKINSNFISKIETRKDIQALRGLAVISVILFHFDKNIFSFGYLGVDVFFLISGFVISNLIYSDFSNNTFSFKKFFYKRFRRIIPALLSYSIFVQIIIYFVLDHRHIIETTKTLIYSLIFVSNVHLSRYLPYFDNGSEYNLVVNLWSLSVEEQFYIIFPLIAFFLRKQKISTQMTIYILFIFISILFMNQSTYEYFNVLKRIFLSYENYLFYSPITRAWEFLFGVIGMFLNQNYIKSSRKMNNFLMLIAPFLLIFFLFSHITINNILRLLIVNFLVLILLIIGNDYKNYKFSIIKFLIFSGNISYSLYLFHQGIFAALRNHNSNTTLQGLLYFDFEKILTASLVFIFIYLISWLNFIFVENRFRKEKYFKLKNFMSLNFAFLFLSILLILSILTDGFLFRSSELKSFENNKKIEILEGTNYLQQNNRNCLNRNKYSDLCKFYGAKEKQIVIIGDSVTSTLVSGFLEENILKDYSIIEFTKGGCPLLYGECNFSMDSEQYKELNKIENSIVILGGRYQKYFDVNSDIDIKKIYLTNTINLFLENNNQVYLLSPIPEPSINERMYYFVNKKYPKFDYRTWKESINLFNDVLFELDLDEFYVINSEKYFCKNNICEFRNKESYYFLDHVHFTYFGAKYFANAIIEQINLRN